MSIKTLQIPEYRYSIEIYIGEIRSGKTLAMVAETHEDLQKDPSLKIYSNIWLNKKFFPQYEHISIKHLERYWESKEEFQNCIFLLDELHQFLDSRSFMHKGQKVITHLLGQLGKRQVTLRGTTHFLDMLDIRLRQYCERKIFITKGLLFNMRQWKPILNVNRILSHQENEQLCIKAESSIRKLINFQFIEVLDKVDFIMAKTYFDMYDTKELIAEMRHREDEDEDEEET